MLESAPILLEESTHMVASFLGLPHIFRDYSTGHNCGLLILKVTVYYRAVGTAAATVALGARLHFPTQCFSLMYTIL